MMFLLRNTHPVAPDLPSISEKKLPKDPGTAPKLAATLEGLIAEDPFPIENGDKDNYISGESTVNASNHHTEFGNHSDVAEDEGWITIPKDKVLDDWFYASNAQQLRSLDRSFVFSGEQLHLLVCLSAAKQDEEVTTPFVVSGVMSKNEKSTQFRKRQNEVSCSTSPSGVQVNENGMLATNSGPSESNDQNLSSSEKMEPEKDVTITKSWLQKEAHRLRIETLLDKFRCSNFFVRIAESDEPLWSKRFSAESSSTNSEMAGGIIYAKDGAPRKESYNFLSAIIDQGSFDCSASGGVARDVRCHSLPNGDMVVLLQVNVAVGNIKDPVLEVLQFEKHGAFVADPENSSDLHSSNHYDPCGELLNWLLPLNRTQPPHSLLPLSGQDQTVATHRSTSSYSGSQIFSFGQFRSYSMPSFSKDSALSISATHNSIPSFDLEDFDCFTSDKSKNLDMENEGLFSFRGVSLVPERFTVHCGFEGIYLPGRRWRRKVEIVQPLEIHSFAALCTTEDLLCVQIKNVSPTHLPDITIFLDAITIIYDEPSKGSPPSYLPLSSIETGGGHNLPNLPLRRGEEHSFILKPVTKLGRNLNGFANAHSTFSHPKVGTTALGSASKASYLKNISPSTDQYAILVSCRCNYTESKLFFKQRMSWRPHIAKDFIISVVSEFSDHSVGSTRLPQLPVQVLTLHASNLTSEDHTLTVLAPLSSASSSSVVPLSSTLRNPINSLATSPEFIRREAVDKNAVSMQRLSSTPPVTEKQKVNDADGKRSVSLAERSGTTSDLISGTDRECTHLWLQSTVPLGVVPAHSSTSVKVELLPLTDGIITLDTLQVSVQDKGLTYIPEQPLKIHATSSIASGIA